MNRFPSLAICVAGFVAVVALVAPKPPAYRGSTVRVKMVAEDAPLYPPFYSADFCFPSSAKAAEYFAGLKYEPREVVIAVYLNNRRGVVGIEEISRGTLIDAPFEPRAILLGAMLANAAAIMVLHNHPSGDPEPSNADVSATKALQDSAKLLPVKILDHIVIAKKGYASLRNLGYLDETSGEQDGK